MRTYKDYVGNQTFPEGCITEQYLNDEAMRYCMEYIPAKHRESDERGRGMCTMDDVEHAHPIDKKGKDYMLSTLQYQQARKWLLKSVDENVDWERKYQTYVKEFQCNTPIFRTRSSN
ncbi:hypothetical protein ACHQM5_001812 [Ranunculus cassubicifolius]